MLYTVSLDILKKELPKATFKRVLNSHIKKLSEALPYRINIIQSVYGDYFQAKGTFGYHDSRKLWVSISLGNKTKTLETYGTIDPIKLQKLVKKEFEKHAYSSIQDYLYIKYNV